MKVTDNARVEQRARIVRTDAFSQLYWSDFVAHMYPLLVARATALTIFQL